MQDQTKKNCPYLFTLGIQEVHLLVPIHQRERKGNTSH